MSGLHLVKKGRQQRKMDLQRDFTVASPAELVTRFGGNRVIDKVRKILFSVFLKLLLLVLFVAVGAVGERWLCSNQ